MALAAGFGVAQRDGTDQRDEIELRHAQQQRPAPHARDVHQIIDEQHQAVGGTHDPVQVLQSPHAVWCGIRQSALRQLSTGFDRCHLCGCDGGTRQP